MAARTEKAQRRAERERKSAELAARERRSRFHDIIVHERLELRRLVADQEGERHRKELRLPLTEVANELEDQLANDRQPARATGAAGRYAYAVGDPGPGAPAPALDLRSTRGGTFDLRRQRGKTTLVYFQEGVGCQPCWDQIRDIERQWPKLHALGIDQMVSVTGNTLDQLRTKAGDEGLRTPLLADPGLDQSRTWSAERYGMMDGAADGHSFVVVGPRGVIRFRADYGGAPDYTMYVPVPDLVADIKRGLAA